MNCAENQNQWQVIVFYTRPKWHFYKQANTVQLDVDLTLIGAGGEVVWSCNNDRPECTGSYNYSLGEGIGKFKLKGGGELDISSTGEIRLEATASGGPCDLFTSFTKISVTCSILFGDKFSAGEQIEFGWARSSTPSVYWVLANVVNFRSMSYEQFAKLNVPFHDRNEKIYYEIKRTGSRRALSNQYFDLINYTFP